MLFLSSISLQIHFLHPLFTNVQEYVHIHQSPVQLYMSTCLHVSYFAALQNNNRRRLADACSGCCAREVQCCGLDCAFAHRHCSTGIAHVISNRHNLFGGGGGGRRWRLPSIPIPIFLSIYLDLITRKGSDPSTLGHSNRTFLFFILISFLHTT